FLMRSRHGVDSCQSTCACLFALAAASRCSSGEGFENLKPCCADAAKTAAQHASKMADDLSIAVELPSSAIGGLIVMDMGIAGKWALVCGASKGLGFGCAQALVREGVHVLIVARGAEALESAAKRLIDDPLRPKDTAVQHVAV